MAPLQSLRSKFFSPENSSDGSKSQSSSNNHGWPAVRQSAPSSHHSTEIATHQSTSPSLQQSEMSESHEYADVQERWQLDPYLDTAGPEYSWMHTEDPENVIPGGSPREKVVSFQSVRRPEI